MPDKATRNSLSTTATDVRDILTQIGSANRTKTAAYATAHRRISSLLMSPFRWYPLE